VADFSIQDAAFTGFGVVRKHPGFLIVWAGFALFVSAVLTCALIAIAGPAMMNLQSLSATGSDPTSTLSLLSDFGPAYFFLIPAILVAYGVLYAAMNRAVLRPDDHKFAYFEFGADELRQIGVLLLGAIVFTVAYFVVLNGFLVAAVMTGSLTHARPALSGFTAISLACSVMAWLAVRLSLASALTFQSRRVNLFGSWALTEGRFWSIFGTYVLVLALAAVIFFLAYFVIVAVVAVAAGGNLRAALAPPNMRSLQAYLNVENLLQLTLGAGVSALVWPVVLTPPAAILRQISVAKPDDAAAGGLQ
jgi:hypothetical protein